MDNYLSEQQARWDRERVEQQSRWDRERAARRRVWDEEARRQQERWDRERAARRRENFRWHVVQLACFAAGSLLGCLLACACLYLMRGSP